MSGRKRKTRHANPVADKRLEAIVNVIGAAPGSTDAWAWTAHPVNLATGKGYGALNADILARTRRVPLLFCTFKQALALDAPVRAGEKSVARVAFYKDDETGDRRVPVHTAVFHVNQLTQTPGIAARVRAYDLQRRIRMLPVWMSKLSALYDQRARMPADHAIALEQTSVPPLVLLAAAAVMRDYDQIAPDKRAADITPDLHPYLWPAVASGLEAAERVVDVLIGRVAAAYEIADVRQTLDATYPRHTFSAPEPYYCEVIYRLCRVLARVALGQPRMPLPEAMAEKPGARKPDADVSMAALASLVAIAPAINLPLSRPAARLFLEASKKIKVKILARVQHAIVQLSGVS